MYIISLCVLEESILFLLKKTGKHKQNHAVKRQDRINFTQPTDEVTNYNIFCTATTFANSSVYRQVFVNDNAVEAIIDTGTDCNVLPKECLSFVTLCPTKTTIKAWGNFPLPVLGKSECSVRYKNRVATATFFVVDVPNMKSLLSLSLCHDLNLISELLPPTTCHKLAPLNSTSISPPYDEVKVPSSIVFESTSLVIANFDKRGLFNGLGCLKGVQYKIRLDDNVKPVSHAARRLPPAVRDIVEEKLRQMVNDKIIVRITEPTDWCSPLVVTSKKSGDLRICCDLRSLNKSQSFNSLLLRS